MRPRGYLKLLRPPDGYSQIQKRSSYQILMADWAEHPLPVSWSRSANLPASFHPPPWSQLAARMMNRWASQPAGLSSIALNYFSSSFLSLVFTWELLLPAVFSRKSHSGTARPVKQDRSHRCVHIPMPSSLHICIFGMNVSHYILMSYYNIQIGDIWK